MRVLILLLATIFVLTRAQDPTQQRGWCVAYRGGQCINCPFNYHLADNQCYRNITGCLEYATNTTGLRICTSCDPAVATLDGQGGCALTIPMARILSHI